MATVRQKIRELSEEKSSKPFRFKNAQLPLEINHSSSSPQCVLKPERMQPWREIKTVAKASPQKETSKLSELGTVLL
jgi:hypothetical protein